MSDGGDDVSGTCGSCEDSNCGLISMHLGRRMTSATDTRAAPSLPQCRVDFVSCVR